MVPTSKVVKTEDSRWEAATHRSPEMTVEQVIKLVINFYNNRQTNIIDRNKELLKDVPKGQEPPKEVKDKLRPAKYATTDQVTRYVKGLNEVYFKNLARALNVMGDHYKELGHLVWDEAKANTVELMKELKAVKTANAQLEESNRVLEEYTKEQQEIINQLEAELRAAKQNNSKKESV